MNINTVILDRDGVINKDSDNYIKSTDEFILIENSVKAILKLNNNNIKIFICTNQSGIGRFFYNTNTFFNMNTKLLKKLKNKNIISSIYYCPHTPDDNCNCRKPKPGMINKIKEHYNIDLNKTVFIGDSLRDLDAANLSGCKYKFLVKTGKGLKTFDNNKKRFNDNNCFSDLNSCVDHILNLN